MRATWQASPVIGGGLRDNSNAIAPGAQTERRGVPGR
jgi:hypothetical protein